MSFHALNYSSHVLGSDIKTHRAFYGTRTIPVQSMSTSSVIFESADHLSNSKKSNCILDTLSVRGASGGFMVNQQNAVGIMGGVSVDSSLSFAGKLVKWSSNDEEAGLPFVLCADPLLNKKLVQYERSSLSLNGRGECLKLDQTSIVENLRSKRVFLESSGAQCIAMPCHISHSWYDEVSKGCSVPVLHMGECVARELKEAKLRPLEAGSPLRIGVLATSATLLAGFYQEKLQNEGFEVVLPDKATMEHTVIPAIEALSRKDIEGARTLLRIALQVLLVRAVNTVILAWDDMRELLPPDDPLLKKCVDPLDALAKSCIHFAQSA